MFTIETFQAVAAAPGHEWLCTVRLEHEGELLSLCFGVTREEAQKKASDYAQKNKRELQPRPPRKKKAAETEAQPETQDAYSEDEF